MRRSAGGAGSPRVGSYALVAGAVLLLLPSCVGTTAPFLAGAFGPAATSPAPRAPSLRDVPPAGTVPPGGPSRVATSLAPLTLTIAGADPTGIGLTWTPTASASFSTYAVEYSPNGSAGPWETVGLVANQSDSAYGVTDLTPGAAYAWRVVENDATLGAQASPVVTETQPAPARLTATVLSSKSIELNWTNTATYSTAVDFTSYTVWESVGTGAPTLVATVNAVSTRFQNVSGLIPSQSYGFQVRTSDCLAGCGGSAPVRATSVSNPVNLGPALPLSANLTTARPVVDVDQLDQFTCAPVGGTAPFTYAWNLGNGTFVGGGEIVSTAFPSPGTGTVSCRVTDASQSQVTAAATTTVALVPSVSASANRTVLEVGFSVEFDAATTLGSPPYTVAWTFGDASYGSGATVTHVYAGAGNFVATCVASDATGTSVSAFVTVQVAPALTTRLTANATAAVPDTDLAFSAVPSNGSRVYLQYDWTFGDGGSSTGPLSSVSHTFARAGQFTVALEVIDTLGGSARASVGVDISNITVSVGSAPTSVTAGAPLAFNASATGGAGAPYTFAWHFSNGVNRTGPDVSLSFSAPGPIVPKLTVTDRLGGRTNLTLSTVTVAPSSPSPPVPSVVPTVVILGVAIAAGALVAVVAERRRRVQSARVFSRVAGRVPDADPSRLVRGRRVCRMCGHSNLAIRASCEACGASLPGRP